MKQTKIIPFDLSLVTDDNVYTRDGRRVRIICTDRKSKGDIYCIIGLISEIEDNKEVEYYNSFTITGEYDHNSCKKSNYDLVIHQELIVNIDFEPFQRVLVRHGINGIWRPAIYSHKSEQLNENNETIEVHYVIGDRRSYCNIIPYDDFKQLINTSDNPTF